MADAKQTIENGKAVLGIEFGSTRIKAVLSMRSIILSQQEHMTGRISLLMEYGHIVLI